MRDSVEEFGGVWWLWTDGTHQACRLPSRFLIARSFLCQKINLCSGSLFTISFVRNSPLFANYTNNSGLSIILGHYSSLTTAPTEIPSLGVPPFAILGTLLRGELERWREVLPDSLANSPLIHLSYWYLRITVELKQADSDSASLLTSAMRIVAQLTHNPTLVTPLTYHPTVLATLTLIKLTDYDSTRAEAESGLKTLMENRIAPSAWDSTIRDMISNRKQIGVATLTSSAESKHASTAAQGLQHLAELATANEEGRDVSMGESRNEGESFAARSTGVYNQFHQNFQEIVKSGYLRVLSGDSGR
jgi:hypothetical protein